MGLPADFVFLGTGEDGYQNMLIWSSNNSSNIRAWIDFKPELSEIIYKGSDMFLMPSLFEPLRNKPDGCNEIRNAPDCACCRWFG